MFCWQVAEMIYNEFFEQGDLEKEKLHIKPIDIMNRDKKDELPSMQVGFIDTICLPVYQVSVTICLPLYQVGACVSFKSDTQLATRIVNTPSQQRLSRDMLRLTDSWLCVRVLPAPVARQPAPQAAGRRLSREQGKLDAAGRAKLAQVMTSSALGTDPPLSSPQQLLQQDLCRSVSCDTLVSTPWTRRV